ncbi:MAG: flagellar filament capping protein FliD [Pirellulales bacterium]|nr:flagellar filament capping protein FliD [Pirellulales bacterium]
MGAISSNIGLITGIPITDTVEKLLSIQARPRDLLAARTSDLKQRQVALTDLAATLLSLQISVKSVGQSTLFQQRSATSSHAELLNVTVTGTPAAGSRQFTPLKLAASHQLLSSGVASGTTALGGGNFTFAFGGFLDQGVDLDLLNGGAGFSRGKIKITDRSGESAEIDLRFAVDIEDVLVAINSNDTIDITASADGDTLRLVDNTGQTASNLKVEEVNGGETAAALGLDGIDVAAAEASGGDIISLGDFLDLAQLNDGRGVAISNSLADLTFQFRDGTSATVDFNAINENSLFVTGSTTAANGADAQLNFAAVDDGTTLDGVQVSFVDNAAVTAGNELYTYDSGAKTLVIEIDEGNTTAANVAASLAADPTAGVLFRAGFAEGSSGSGVIDVTDAATLASPTEPPVETTLGDLLETLNTSLAGRLRAEIAGSGDGLVFTDLTTDNANTFSVTSVAGNSILEDLGVQDAAVADVITGGRIQGGLQTVLLSTLNGGQGFGTLGQISLQDRNGSSDTVDLSGAETLDDVLNLINAATTDITAALNPARNGIQLTDTSGGNGTLIVANGDATNSADAFSIAVNANVDSVNSGSLRRQVVTEQTRLENLNGGAGVAKGRITITNADGDQFTIRLDQNDIETVGDVINEINSTATDVVAQINDAGDGLVLIDNSGGAGIFRVEEAGSTTARDLHILGDGSLITVGGQQELAIDGATTVSIDLAATDTLEDLAEQINELSGGRVQAALVNDGTSVNPVRLSLASQQTGKKGELLLDISGLNLSFIETTAASDAVLLLGGSDTPVPILAVSETNTFEDVIDGASVTINQASLTSVNVNITTTNTNFLGSIEAIVNTYNSLRDKIDDLTEFDEVQNVSAVLQGDSAVLRVDADLSRLLSGRFFGAGEIQNLGQLGITFSQDGKLELDKDVLEAKLASDRESVEEFFTKTESGFAAKFEALTEQLAGEGASLLTSRIESITRRVEDNEQRLVFLDERLEKVRERLLNQFFRAETAIAKIQNNLSAISGLTALPPL